MLNREHVGDPAFQIELVTAFTPEPLSTLLAAHLEQLMPEHRVLIRTGLFGDLTGNLTRALERGRGPVVLVTEWSAIDLRLGLRSAGNWGRGTVPDIVRNAGERLDLIAGVLEKAPSRQVYIVPPLLPLPPVLPVAPWQPNALEIELANLWHSFILRVSRSDRVCPVSPALWDAIPRQERLDVKSWLQAGFPYRLTFASELAQALALCIAPPAPLKGIITDLDDTLWSGILGEVGASQVAWDLDHHAAAHGAYQLMLQALAEDGVLVAIASKNDPRLVTEALSRPDLLLRPDSIFPVEAHWQPKTESAARILAAWNIGPESAMFIDDNPLEVETMQSAFPSMHCRRFPARDPDSVNELLSDLAGHFGKTARREEDGIRLQSLRSAAHRDSVRTEPLSHEQVLRESGGRLTITEVTIPPDPRALELINKTNQFNLNGKRYTESEWLDLICRGRAWMASYQDKFGPLGKISVLAGKAGDQNDFHVECWVMSCRAFSRHIEYAMLEFLFAQGIEVIHLDFEPTERNGPLREFLAAQTEIARAPVSITRAHLESVQPCLSIAVTAL